MSSFLQLFVIVVLMSVAHSTVQNSSCPVWNLRARDTLRYLRKNFMFVEKRSATQPSSLANPRRAAPGTTLCPWTWGYDDNPDRVPRFLTKAVCPNCKHYCREVFYHHGGLVKSCNATTWKWSEVELPVAFVYDP